VAATLAVRTAGIARRMSDLGLEPLPDDRRGPHLLGVRLPEPARARVVPALAGAGCFAAVRGASLRIAPHLHTSDEDVERLVSALSSTTQATSTGGPA
jgi:selenocysteine lyase/cysteine desulfurase